MSNDQMIIYVICGAMFLRAFTSKKKVSFEIYKDCMIENKFFFRLEKILMALLPLLVTFLYTAFTFNDFVIRLWMLLIVFLDIALQYFGNALGYLKEKENVISKSSLIIWVVFGIALFFTIK